MPRDHGRERCASSLLCSSDVTNATKSSTSSPMRIERVYVSILIGVGTAVGDRGNSFLITLAAVAIAIAFQRVRERVRHFANRIVYGKRSTPYEVLPPRREAGPVRDFALCLLGLALLLERLASRLLVLGAALALLAMASSLVRSADGSTLTTSACRFNFLAMGRPRPAGPG